MVFERGKTYTKSEMSRFYNVSVKTFRNWIEPVVKANKKQFPPVFKHKKIINVTQLNLIVEHLGEPS
jgi:hypothetical protein